MASMASPTPRKPRRRKKSFLESLYTPLGREQVGAWGVLLALALLLGVLLVRVATALATAVADLQAGGLQQGSGLVVAGVQFVVYLALAAAVVHFTGTLYSHISTQSAFRLRAFSLGSTVVGLAGLGYSVATPFVGFHSNTVTVVYFAFLSFCSLWAFAANRTVA